MFRAEGFSLVEGAIYEVGAPIAPEAARDPGVGSSTRQMYQHAARLRELGHETAAVTTVRDPRDASPTPSPTTSASPSAATTTWTA